MSDRWPEHAVVQGPGSRAAAGVTSLELQAAKRPWKSPQVILATVGLTANGSSTANDAPHPFQFS